MAVVVIGGVIWQSNKDKPQADGYGSVQNSAVQVSYDQGITTIGLPNAGKTVELYEDPMCPYCAELENTYGQALAQKIDSGAIAIRYHMLDFLNNLSSSGDYSTRAVAASACVARGGDAVAFSKFHSGLFASSFQPEERSSSDHSNDDLAQLARDSGASDAVTQCISSGSGVADAATDTATARTDLAATGSNGTPTVVVDGKVVDALGNSGWVDALG